MISTRRCYCKADAKGWRPRTEDNSCGQPSELDESGEKNGEAGEVFGAIFAASMF